MKRTNTYYAILDLQQDTVLCPYHKVKLNYFSDLGHAYFYCPEDPEEMFQETTLEQIPYRGEPDLDKETL